jgi:hypothetical protein
MMSDGAGSEDAAFIAFLLGKLGVPTMPRSSLLSFEVITEPLLWLAIFVKEKPKRLDFVGPLEVPGPWLMAFSHSLTKLYPEITPHEVAHLSGSFSEMSREYFAWSALGRTCSEGERMVERLENLASETSPLIGARALFDKLDARRVTDALGADAGRDFARHATASRLVASRRTQANISAALRRRPDGSATPAKITAQNATAPLVSTAPSNPIDTHTPARNPPPPASPTVERRQEAGAVVEEPNPTGPTPRKRSRKGKQERKRARQQSTKVKKLATKKKGSR